MITWENYEEYIMMHADGELQPAEQHELDAFLNAHPELKNEMALYEAAHILVDSSLTYDRKGVLLRPLPAKRIIAFPLWVKYGMAACVVALLFVSLLKYRDTGNKSIEVTRAKVTEPVLPVLKSEIIQKQEVAAIQENVERTHHRAKISSVVVHGSGAMPIAHNTHVNIIRSDRKELPVNRNEPVSLLSVAEIKKMPCENGELTNPVQRTVPVYALTENNTSDKRSFIDRLPIDDIKKNELKNIAGAIADVYDDVSDRGRTADEKRVSIKIRRQKLIVSF